MKTTFTKEYIIENKGCYSFKEVNSLPFMKKRVITLKDIIDSKIPFKDKIYFIWTSCNFNYVQREDLYNKSKLIQDIFIKKFPNYTSRGLVFDFWDFFNSCCDGRVAFTTKEKQIILQEILNYSKQFNK